MALTLESRTFGPEDVIAGCSCLSMGPPFNLNLSQEDCDAAAAALFDAGIRDFDTAPLYGAGTSEERLGRALRSAEPEQGAARVWTKVGRLLFEADGATPVGPGCDAPGRASSDTRVIKNDYTAEGAKRSLKESLARLGLSTVHGLRVHDPNDNHTMDGTTDEVSVAALEGGALEALRELRAEGIVKHIGLGMNCNKESHMGKPDEILRLIKLAKPNTFDSALLAGGWNLLNQDGMQCLLECEKRGIDVYIAGVYASGLLVGGSTYSYIQAPEAMLEKTKKWRGIAEKHGFSLPAVALAFAFLPKCVKGIVLGMALKSHVEEAMAYLEEANRVPESLWAEAQDLGLLVGSISLPKATSESKGKCM